MHLLVRDAGWPHDDGLRNHLHGQHGLESDLPGVEVQRYVPQFTGTRVHRCGSEPEHDDDRPRLPVSSEADARNLVNRLRVAIVRP